MRAETVGGVGLGLVIGATSGQPTGWAVAVGAFLLVVALALVFREEQDDRS